MDSKTKSLAELKPGEKAVIQDFKDDAMSLKLLEMGCLPNSQVSLYCRAPLGDPICVKVCNSCLLLRLSEAATIVIKPEK